MAYTEDPDVVQGAITASDLSEDTKDAINDLIDEVAEGGDVVVSGIGAGEDSTDLATADFAIIDNPDGLTIGDTDASVIVAGAGSGALSIDITTENATGQRNIVGSEAGDSVNVESDDAVAINSGSGDDSISTGEGFDSVTGGAGDDSVSTGEGNDSVAVGEGNDSVDTGEDVDLVNFTTEAETIEIGEDGVIIITNDVGEATSIDNAELISLSEDGTRIFAVNEGESAADAELFELIVNSVFGDDELPPEIAAYLDSLDAGIPLDLDALSADLSVVTGEPVVIGSIDTIIGDFF